MQALVFEHNLAREAAATIGGRVDKRAFVSKYAPVSLKEVPEPVPPAAGWVRCETVISGLCGSDAKQIFLNGSRDNPLTALVSFPHVLGHEAVARRLDTGPARRAQPVAVVHAPGHRAALRGLRRRALPVVPQLHQGRSPRRHPPRQLCRGGRRARGALLRPREPAVRRPRDHERRRRRACRTRSASRCARSCSARPSPSRPVLVYGSGTLAFAAIGLLAPSLPAARDLGGHPVRVPVVARRQAGRRRRADLEARRPRRARSPAGRASRPSSPGAARTGCRTAPASSTTRSAAPRPSRPRCACLQTGGTLVVSGVEPPKRFEWTPMYFKELRVVGSNGFGIEEVAGVRKHAFEHYFDFARAGLDLTPVVTHRFRSGALARGGARPRRLPAHRGGQGALRALSAQPPAARAESASSRSSISSRRSYMSMWPGTDVLVQAGVREARRQPPGEQRGRQAVARADGDRDGHLDPLERRPSPRNRAPLRPAR